ncbi:MAG: hypothetical protein K8H89_06410 [Flavobacteriales bacterium]|nr:hypothetical protein [Flavobacteriales bacterium]
MKAEKFICVWREFVGEEKFLNGETWHDAWHEKNKPWTLRILGEAHASEKDSPLGDHLVKNLGKSWRYRTEEWKVDLVVAKKDSNWGTPPGWENWEKDWKGLFWPSTYEILVEHEGECWKSYEEMAKLILLRSRLKVLITYTEDAGRKDSSSLITETRKQFKAMICAASESLLEPEDVRYVLIVGRLEGKGLEAVPKWYSSIFSATGDVLHNDPIPTDGE